MPTRNEEGLITLTSDEVLDFALDTLLKGVKLYINGYKCTAQNVYEIILKASAGQTSVNDVCDDLKGTPKGNTVLGQLHQALPQKLSDLWRLEVKLNRVLLLNVPERMLRVRCDLAIDLVLVPYHGEPAKDAEEVKRSAAREGTTHFHCYATAYMVYKDHRITLAMTFVRKSDTMLKIVRRLFKRLDVLEIRIKKAYLDKGFYSIGVIRFLKERDLPFIIPAVTRKKGGVSESVHRSSELFDLLHPAQSGTRSRNGGLGHRAQIQQGPLSPQAQQVVRLRDLSRPHASFAHLSVLSPPVRDRVQLSPDESCPGPDLVHRSGLALAVCRRGLPDPQLVGRAQTTHGVRCSSSWKTSQSSWVHHLAHVSFPDPRN